MPLKFCHASSEPPYTEQQFSNSQYNLPGTYASEYNTRRSRVLQATPIYPQHHPLTPEYHHTRNHVVPMEQFSQEYGTGQRVAPGYTIKYLPQWMREGHADWYPRQQRFQSEHGLGVHSRTKLGWMPGQSLRKDEVRTRIS